PGGETHWPAIKSLSRICIGIAVGSGVAGVRTLPSRPRWHNAPSAGFEVRPSYRAARSLYSVPVRTDKSPMARKARAAICRTHNQPITVEEISVDPPKRGEVTVRLAACGVCHSDLSAITGTIVLPLPLVLGHEGAGVVEEVGEGVRDFAKGDHVVFSFIYMCGKCRFCVSGRPVLCLEQGKALTTPLEGSPRVHDASGAPLSIFSGCGAMAEYATVSAENLIK